MSADRKVNAPTLEDWAKRLSGTGRIELISMIYVRDRAYRDSMEIMTAYIDRLQAELDHVRGELAKLKGGIVLKGWTCAACGVFNGEEREPRTHCRSCDRAHE